MALILERDGKACVWCRRPLEVGFVEATTEHVVPRLKGGPSWIENEVAACVEAGRRALRETAGHPGGVHAEVVGHRKAAVTETLAQDVAQPDR